MMTKAKKILSIMLIFLLVFSSTLTAFADSAEEVSKEDQKKQEEQLEARKEAEKKAAEEQAKKEAEEKARKEAEAKKAAEEKAKKEAEAKKAAEEQAKKEAEKKAAEEQAKKAAEEQAEKEAEEKAAASADSQGEADESTDEGSSSDDQDQAAPSEEAEAGSGAEEVLSDGDESDLSDDDEAGDKKSSLKLQAGLSDGTYKPDSFEFSGGTGKAKFTCDKVIVKDGKMTAEFTASSENMTHIYMGTVSSDAEDTSLYDPATGKRGKDVYKITDKKAYIEVVTGESKPFAARSTAMSEPHWIQYQYKLTLSDSSEKTSDDTTIPDQGDDSGSTGLSDGTYKPEAFDFSGGTGKAKVTCEKVIVKNGKATAEFTASSDNMTHFYMGTVSSDAEDTSLYDPTTDKCGSGVYKISSNKAYVPVTLNEQKPFAGRTTAMSEPHWVQYQYKITLTEKAEKISDDTTIPGEGDDPDPDPDDPDPDPDPSGDDEPSGKGTLKDGTYKVKATTCRVMFYLYPKEKNPATAILVKKNGKMTATITLTGDGYDYVYMGTPAQAKKAGKKKWIKYKKVNGYYTFEIPVSKLDKKLPITPHSYKYEHDGDPKTDPWRPDKWILFYSSGAKKVKDGTTIKPDKKKKDDSGSGSKTDNKAEKESKYKDDSGKSTSSVNNSTSLKDGVYKPDRFSWSGGSGRLKYLRCNKITVKGGKAFATIEFGSSKYDSLKANGRVYSRSGGGNSQFTIPVKLNANNTIIGKTTAMSQPHWIKYNIFIYKKGAGAGKNGTGSEEGDDGHVTSTKKLSSKAPDLMGLEFKEEVKVEYAEYFKIYKYEQGIILIEVDQATDTALYQEDKEEKKDDSGETAEDDGASSDGGDGDAGSDDQGHVEYDEDGNIIAQSQNEIVDGLYQNNVVNYIVVPENVEIPAGLDKDGIILQQPIDKTFLASEKAAEALEQLEVLDKVKTVGFDAEKDGSEALKKELDAESMALAGTVEKPDYAELVKSKANMSIFPSSVLPEKLKKDASEEEKTESDEKTKNIGILRKRFSALGVPMLIDRSDNEKTNYGSAEWIKVYGAVFGKEEEAGKIFDDFVAKNKKENNEK